MDFYSDLKNKNFGRLVEMIKNLVDIGNQFYLNLSFAHTHTHPDSKKNHTITTTQISTN